MLKYLTSYCSVPPMCRGVLSQFLPSYYLNYWSLLCLLSPQIQFPALAIRLSYNDVQLFLAIAKSIPTGSPRVADPDSASQAAPSTASPDTTSKPKDSFRHRTEALIGRTYRKQP